MREVLKHPSFARLFYATLISQSGTQIHRVALLVLVYTLTQEAIWVSLILAAQLVATIALGPLISAWADTQERRRLLVGSDLARMLIVPLIPILGIYFLPGLLVLVFLNEAMRTVHDHSATVESRVDIT